MKSLSRFLGCVIILLSSYAHAMETDEEPLSLSKTPSSGEVSEASAFVSKIPDHYQVLKDLTTIYSPLEQFLYQALVAYLKPIQGNMVQGYIEASEEYISAFDTVLREVYGLGSDDLFIDPNYKVPYLAVRRLSQVIKDAENLRQEGLLANRPYVTPEVLKIISNPDGSLAEAQKILQDLTCQGNHIPYIKKGSKLVPKVFIQEASDTMPSNPSLPRPFIYFNKSNHSGVQGAMHTLELLRIDIHTGLTHLPVKKKTGMAAYLWGCGQKDFVSTFYNVLELYENRNKIDAVKFNYSVDGTTLSLTLPQWRVLADFVCVTFSKNEEEARKDKEEAYKAVLTQLIKLNILSYIALAKELDIEDVSIENPTNGYSLRTEVLKIAVEKDEEEARKILKHIRAFSKTLDIVTLGYISFLEASLENFDREEEKRKENDRDLLKDSKTPSKDKKQTSLKPKSKKSKKSKKPAQSAKPNSKSSQKLTTLTPGKNKSASQFKPNPQKPARKNKANPTIPLEQLKEAGKSVASEKLTQQDALFTLQMPEAKHERSKKPSALKPKASKMKKDSDSLSSCVVPLESDPIKKDEELVAADISTTSLETLPSIAQNSSEDTKLVPEPREEALVPDNNSLEEDSVNPPEKADDIEEIEVIKETKEEAGLELAAERSDERIETIASSNFEKDEEKIGLYQAERIQRADQLFYPPENTQADQTAYSPFLGYPAIPLNGPNCHGMAVPLLVPVFSPPNLIPLGMPFVHGGWPPVPMLYPSMPAPYIYEAIPPQLYFSYQSPQPKEKKFQKRHKRNLS